MTKILAFDVSETLQTGSKHDDNGQGQPMSVGNKVIPGAYSVMVGGQKTAELLQCAQKKGIPIFLVTNNSADLDKEVIQRTLDFFKLYGVNIPPENYMGPEKGTDGSKVPRLEAIALRFNVNKEEIYFFDDSFHNVSEARIHGFKAIQVKSPEDLQNGITEVLEAPSAIQKAEKSPSIAGSNSSFFTNEWDELDVEFKNYISETTRKIRVRFFNNVPTSEYWSMMGKQDKDVIFQDYLHKKSRTYDTLDAEFRSFLSEETQSIRRNMAPMRTTEAFWNQLDEKAKDQYFQKYEQAMSCTL
ncbi:HAD family hydrolase [Legionella parisiensis]|uniref:Uncharacterized protein n=1 Tax=Legionella parisiensis TaxID=45071 RepID=A0A1E5JWP3_9GAMM|nr:HAD family hydrolase [Legionella parisiensis]KTD42259.1 hypothetical protein Lpar_3576 [Legionella parisiensis]OEH48932.1 hypothetical protein lpari_00077 [Legionella parisiensis]STX72327.1 HAD phosphatase, family IIIC [Legionella parisiensis]